MKKPPKHVVRALERINTELIDGETVKCSVATGAIINGAGWPGALALTNQRLIFHSSAGSMWLKAKSTLNLDEITSFEYSATATSNVILALTTKTLKIYSRGSEHTFVIDSKNNKEDTENFMNQLAKCEFGRKGDAPSKSSLSADLVTLAKLYEQGLLTKDEFSKAKEELL